MISSKSAKDPITHGSPSTPPPESPKAQPVPKNNKPKICDLGCGCGITVILLEKLGYDAIGIDSNESALGFCRKRNAPVKYGQIENHGFLPQETMDAILMLDVLEHLNDDSKAIENALEVLKKGGILIVTVPAYLWLWTKRDDFHHHIRRYDRKGLLGLSRNKNVQLLTLTYINTFLFPLALVERLAKKYFFRKHHWWLHHQLYRISTEYLRKNMHRLKGCCFEPFEDLGPLTQAPELDLGTNQPVVVEMTLDPSFVVAVGHLHPGGPYRMPGPTWDALDGTAYFLRILDPTCRKTLAAYKWEKTTPAQTPPSYAELKGWAP